MWVSLSPVSGPLLAFGVAFSYVLSLYAWPGAYRANRDDPNVIQQRLLSAVLVSVFNVLCIGLLATDPEDAPKELGPGPNLLVWVGLEVTGAALVSTLVSLLLTAILFLGPLVELVLTDVGLFRTATVIISSPTADGSKASRAQALASLRDYVAAPLTEEIVYRGVMYCVLRFAGYGGWACVGLSLVLFGLAHIHHYIRSAWDEIQCGPLLQGLLRYVLPRFLGHFLVTGVFGMYAGFLFLRTGSLGPPVACHAFCNLMGPPMFGWLSRRQGGRPGLSSEQLAIGVAHVLGLGLFAVLLVPLTNPALHPAATELNRSFEIASRM